jgi:Rrf2 family protein
MKLSKRSEYALRALIDLGIASQLDWPMLQVSKLAMKEKLPIKFLEQIFAQLKAAGCVKSRRGKFGGYSLARPMSRIKFGDVIRLIDGPLAPIRCVSQTFLRALLLPGRSALRPANVDARRSKRHQHNARSPYPGRNRRDHTSQISPRQGCAAFSPSIGSARVDLVQGGRAAQSRQERGGGTQTIFGVPTEPVTQWPRETRGKIGEKSCRSGNIFQCELASSLPSCY